MAEVLQFIDSWWGLLTVVLFLIGYAIYDWRKARKLIASMIFHAEERAKELVLENGEAKFNWVKENTYPMLPKWMRLFLTQNMYRALIQKVFDELKKWAITRLSSREQSERGFNIQREKD